MDYYSILNLDREPFSNSPDPEYFFKSRQHFSCLQKIELAIRLRRGLNVVIGEVGTGKTTLCRQLIKRLSVDQKVETHLILDPSFDSAFEFLSLVSGILNQRAPLINGDQRELKENIKHQLFRKGIEENKIVCLIIDEGQKLPPYCIEILREFLNYETNEYKLLQIVVFAQEEFVKILITHPNFADRINLFRTLVPLNFRDTHLMIRYRLKLASKENLHHSLFTWPAYWAIYRHSKGYPRKIIHLCHQSVLAMIIQNRKRIGHNLVNACAQKAIQRRKIGTRAQHIYAILIVFLVILPISMVIKKISDRTLEKTASEYYSVSPRYQVPMLIKSKKKPIQTPSSQDQYQKNYASKGSPPSSTVFGERADSLSPMPPFILGTLTTNRDDKIENIFQAIHGISTRDYMESFLTLNPHVEDPNTVSAGTIVQLPAVSVSAAEATWNQYRLEWLNSSNLAEAKATLMAQEASHDRLRMIAYWNREKGLRFSICFEKFYRDLQLARKKQKAFRSRFGRTLEIVKDWNEETIFFSVLPKDNLTKPR